MKRVSVTSLIVCIVCNVSCEYFEIDKSVLDKYVFKNASKYWHKYITAFVHSLPSKVRAILLVDYFKISLKVTEPFTKVHELQGGKISWQYSSVPLIPERYDSIQRY